MGKEIMFQLKEMVLLFLAWVGELSILFLASMASFQLAVAALSSILYFFTALANTV